ncbi:17625_t:CDS:2, partial [Racocetra persica]
ADGSPVNSPTDLLYGTNVTAQTKATIKCTDPLPNGAYPMPRCYSDIMCMYGVQQNDINTISSYRSYRSTSHLATFFAQFVSFDITSSKNTLSTYPMFLPADDPFYVLNGSSPNSPQIDVNFLPANRSAGNDGTNPLTSGINLVTPFLDLNNIYSSNDTLMLTKFRDTSSKRGKLKVSIASNGDQYPPKTPSGDYDLGATSTRSRNIFTVAIHTIWLREHNRMCDQLYQIYQDSWTDDQYFQEARRWTTAFYQKAVAEEYIGAVLGRPLPAYQNYNPDLKPGIDTFFATVTFRYGHSELSDLYQIRDDHGDVLTNVALNDIKDLTLLENFGLEKVLLSMVLQRQEDVDNFFSNSTKKAIGPDQVTYDLASFDLIRSRDRGIPLYNKVRQFFNLPQAQSFSDISNLDKVEALVGVMCEPHLDGANFGMTMNASIVTQ